MLSKKYPKCFGVQKLSKYLSSFTTFINYFLHAKCSLTVTDVQRETNNAIAFNELCSMSQKRQKCVKFAITNGLSKICPRKCWMTDRSPNRIRTFSEVQNFWTPIYTSTNHTPNFSAIHPAVSEIRKRGHICTCAHAAVPHH